MKMGNIVPRSGLELTPFAFRHNVLTIMPELTITPPTLPGITTLSTPTCLSGSLPKIPHPGIVSLLNVFLSISCVMLTITYTTVYSKTSLNRPTPGPTLSGPFREVFALGS